MEPSFLLAATTGASPGVPHWMTTAIYLWLAMLCTWAWRGGRGAGGRLGSLLWIGLAAMFAALAIARPIGLQWKLAEAFRHRAVAGEWYDVRRRYQAQIILVVVAAATLTTIVIAAFAFRARSLRTQAAFAPVVILLGFLAVRAVSFHYVDLVLYRRVGGVEVNTVLELTLLGLVAAGLAWRASGAHAGAPGGVVDQDDASGARRYSVR